MRTMRTSSALLRVLAQVEGRQHAERHRHDAHESTIITVPKMAGKMPPSVFDSRGSPVRNSHSRLA